MKKILLFTVCIFLGFSQIKAQTSCIGGGQIRVEIICIEMLAGGEAGNEEVTILTTLTDNVGNVMASNVCTTEDADIGSGGQSGQTGPGFGVIDTPYPWTSGNYGDNNAFPSTFDINFQVWEDDRGGRCSLDINGGTFDDDDDNNCTSATTTVPFSTIWGAGGSCSDGVTGGCTDTGPNVFTVGCNGDWNITYMVTADLDPKLALSCPVVEAGQTETLYAYASDGATLLTGGTWSIQSGGGSIVDNGDGTATFDATGATVGTTTIAQYIGQNCCRTITDQCAIVIDEPCPVIESGDVTITPAGNTCDGTEYSLATTVTSPSGSAITENTNYFVVWEVSYDNGASWTEIADGRGADNNAGTADDMSVLSITHTPTNSQGNCGVQEVLYRAIPGCIKEGTPLTFNGSINYFGDDATAVNTDGICFGSTQNVCLNLDLSTLPTGSTTTTIQFSGDGSAACCSPSYASEAHLGFIAPDGTCQNIDAGADLGFPSSSTAWNFPLTTETGLAGTNAVGVWQICFVDDFADNPDGTIFNLFMSVGYALPLDEDDATEATSMAGGTGSAAAPLKVCGNPVAGTDYTLPNAANCENAVTNVCAGGQVMYSTDNGTTYTSMTPPTAANGVTVYYQISSTDPDCISCAVTGDYTISNCPECNDPCFAEWTAGAANADACATALTLMPCDDGDPCTENDMGIVGQDGTTVCTACVGTPIAAPTADAGSDVTVCEGLDANLAATFGGSAASGMWSGGAGTFGDATMGTTTYTPATSEAGTSVTLTWTASSPNNCGTATDNVIVIITATPTADAGMNATICEDASATLAATSGGSATGGIWSGGAGTFGNSAMASTTYTPDASEAGTTVTLTWTTNDPGSCGAATSTVDIQVDALPMADAGAPQTVCASVGMATLAANTPTVGTGMWSGTGGTFSSMTDPAATVTGLTAGTYTYTWTVSNGVCTPQTSMVTITVVDDPTADAGADVAVCDGDAVNLFAQAGGSATGGMWSGGAGTFGNATMAGTTYTPTAAEVGTTVVLTWTTDDPSGCGAGADDVDVTINANPEPGITCPPATLGKCDGNYNCMFLDNNATTSANGTTAAPIIGGSAAAFITDNTGTLDPLNAPVGVPLTLTLNYQDPVTGCLGTPVTCTFTIVDNSQSSAGGF